MAAPATVDDLNEAARRFIAAAREEFSATTCGRRLGVNHWLRPLARLWPVVVRLLVPRTDVMALHGRVAAALRAGDAGHELTVEQALSAAAALVNDRPPGMADLATVVLKVAGFEVNPREDELLDWCQQYDAPPRPKPARTTTTAARPDKDGATARAIDTFGEDLTAMARQGQFSPVVGRDDELDLMIEVLCRRTKRNPVLVGPPGVGKTALVEGLAQRMVADDVPDLLKGRRLIAVPVAALNAARQGPGMWIGELEARILPLLEQSKEEGAILFIDELHTVIGAGASFIDPNGGLENMLKPALARGDVGLIGATTDAEYRRIVQPEGAFERRLQPIAIGEMSADASLAVLRAHRELLADEGIAVADAVLAWQVGFAQSQMPNRYLPDKALDLLDQSAAFARTRDLDEVTLDIAEAVAQRLVGYPRDVIARLGAAEQQLVGCGLLTATAAEQLADRLAVTIRGFDWNPVRPNAVILAAGLDAASCESLARSLAEAVYGDAGRLISLDLGTVAGSGMEAVYGVRQPGGGYSETPLSRLANEPWSVVWFSHLDALPANLRLFLREALEDGYLNLPSGKRLYFSNTIVVLSVSESAGAQTEVGFRERRDGHSTVGRAERLVGPELMRAIDLTIGPPANLPGSLRQWLEGWFVPHLTQRYEREGYQLRCGAGVLDWLLEHQPGQADLRAWERLVEHRVAPLLADFGLGRPGDPLPVELKVNGDGLEAVVLDS